jgi:uncharacterized protein with PIN domain
MKEKCAICNEEIETIFLNKLKGTVVKTGSGENSKKYYICSDCQKESKNNIKEKISNKDLISKLYK